MGVKVVERSRGLPDCGRVRGRRKLAAPCLPGSPRGTRTLSSLSFRGGRPRPLLPAWAQADGAEAGTAVASENKSKAGRKEAASRTAPPAARARGRGGPRGRWGLPGWGVGR